jgi:hypothetical protein
MAYCVVPDQGILAGDVGGSLPVIPNLFVTEIMFNSPVEGTDNLEYIEYYNAGDEAANLEGCYFSSVIEFTFPDVTVEAGEYIVVAADAVAFENVFGFTPLQWDSGDLPDAGQMITLNASNDEVISSHVYISTNLPQACGGYGPSAELTDIDPQFAEWVASTTFAGFTPEGEAVYGTPGAAISEIPAQSMLLDAGLSGISSYIEPAETGMENLFEPIENEISFIQNFHAVYWPEKSVNSISEWNPQKGYLINLDAKKYFVFSGSEATTNTVNLTKGWNLIPVLTKCAAGIADMFINFEGTLYVFDPQTGNAYSPEYGLAEITEFMPGKAYFVKISANTTITFPDCE